ncbi:hypothetical protein D3C75_779420 [compost metagenome]
MAVVVAGQQCRLFFPCVFETIREVNYGKIPNLSRSYTTTGVALVTALRSSLAVMVFNVVPLHPNATSVACSVSWS